MKLPDLDIGLLRTFITIAETENFTQAGELIGASQSTISVRINKLEDKLGERIMYRTPQAVKLTNFGKDFLISAQKILDVHDEVAVHTIKAAQQRRISLGVSDHVVGPHLAKIVSTLQDELDNIQFLVTAGSSPVLLKGFYSGDYDIAIVRNNDNDPSGTRLFKDRLVWAASHDFSWKKGTPIPLIALASECSIRAFSTRTLSNSKLEWKEVFLGTGVAAVQSAISMGLGIACIEARNAPDNCKFIKGILPDLPSTEIKVHYNKNTIQNNLIRKLLAKFRQVKSGNIE